MNKDEGTSTTGNWSVDNLKGKKLLILGGSYQHNKIVKAAKQLGIETWVTDYLEYEDSPAKHIADHWLMLNIMDVDEIVNFCKHEKIDGVIGPYLDPVQKPYAEICEKLNLPCFGTAERTDILTDKSKFKKFCFEHGADIIPSYSASDIEDNKVEYPVLIKPSDSRGSRGQTVCYKKEETTTAIAFAKSESRTGDIEIEKYMGTGNDVQLIYLIIDGKPMLLRIEDRFLGSKEDNLDKLCIGVRYPSAHEGAFRQSADHKIRSMLKELGLRNAPIFIQAFMDGDKARLYDPGLRMPGDENDLAYKYATGIDMPQAFVYFALTGEFPVSLKAEIEKANPVKHCLMLLPCVREGKIQKITGIEELKSDPHILAVNYFYHDGDMVERYDNVKQRFAEILIGAETIDEVKMMTREVFERIHVLDTQGQEMLIDELDIESI